MWLIEKDPTDPTDHFLPVNLDNVTFIDVVKSDEDPKYGIRFNFNIIKHDTSFWIKWWFKEELTRDKYLAKILEKLPQLDLGVDDISL